MAKNRKPLIITNWRGNVSDLAEAKKILLTLNREYSKLLRGKYKKLKKKLVSKDLDFLLSVPAPFIFPMQEYLKSQPTFKKLIIGAQGFDSLEKTNQNNQITLPEIKSVGAKFVILNDKSNLSLLSEASLEEELGTVEENFSKTADDLILNRLNHVSRKISEEKVKAQAKSGPLILEQHLEFQEKNSRDLTELEEKVRLTIASGLTTILVLRNSKTDLEYLINFIKSIIENLHYNLFNKLIICYETTRGQESVDYLEIEDCQESVIAIRRTIANIFGIDNAKKVKIVYSGRINETNVREILENTGVDGLLLNEEAVYPKLMAKILTEIN